MLGHHPTPPGARPVSVAQARHGAAVAAMERYRLDMLMEAFAMADRHPGPPHLDHVRGSAVIRTTPALLPAIITQWIITMCNKIACVRNV
jgi:hypothetical protein